METLNLGIEVEQGADLNLIIGISGVNGPIDITDYGFLGEMKASTDPNSPLVAEFDFAIQNQLTNKGQVLWNLAASTNEEIATSIATALTGCRLSTPFIFDIKMKDAIGNITRIIQGLIYLSPQATQEQFS